MRVPVDVSGPAKSFLLAVNHCSASSPQSLSILFLGTINTVTPLCHQYGQHSTHRNMAPRSQSPSDDDDAPETIALSQSKVSEKKREAQRQDAVAAGRHAQKEKNRELDRKLKERAQRTQGKASAAQHNTNARQKRKHLDRDDHGSEEGDDVSDNELETRMRRSMREADEEGSDEGKEDEDDGGGPLEDGPDSDGLEFSEEDGDEEDEHGDVATDADDDDDMKQEGPSRKRKGKLNPDHLPDELFAAAFSSTANSKPKRKAEEDVPNPSAVTKKRKRTKPKTPKDVIVGSRAIRVLPSSQAPSTPSALPSRKIRKFLDRSLAFKDGKQALRTRGWERRSANIGVLRRDGPPLAFVRSR
ncbi:unnamed protein product [Cyclocybe aegerita]|uniref:Uncharacterized protein n=1 Tax=Cyclocybe aegerita TaxID=1973307 RepID=A0A8S0WHK7_CYCAE|nr:unnamed protein product [Cyclocybe aegerita]